MSRFRVPVASAFRRKGSTRALIVNGDHATPYRGQEIRSNRVFRIESLGLLISCEKTEQPVPVSHGLNHIFRMIAVAATSTKTMSQPAANPPRSSRYTRQP